MYLARVTGRVVATEKYPGLETVPLQWIQPIDEDGEAFTEAATGDGPVAAAFRALERVTGVHLTLRNFELHSTSVGEDAQGEVTVTVEHDGNDYRGHGASVDIVEAGSVACLEVVNRILRRRHHEAGPVDSDASADRALI